MKNVGNFLYTIQKIYATHGFIKRTSPRIIPTLVMNLCLLYYEDIIYWEFKRKKLQNFIESSFGTILTRTFTYNKYVTFALD